jgi:elongation factor G
MPQDLNQLRNIGIMAHIDAGKTTTTERILYLTKKIYKMGEVDAGTATMDWMPEEQKRGITITSAATTFTWKETRFNLIDTPGHVDFTVEVERSLRVLDGAITILCGVGGVEPQTETVWRQAQKHSVPRIVYINKLDRMGASLEKTFASFQSKLSRKSALVHWAIGEEADFKGIIDLVHWKAYCFSDSLMDPMEEISIPENYIEEAQKRRYSLIEYLADFDDALLTHFLEGSIPPPALLKKIIRQQVLKGEFFPVFCGASFKNKGLPLLLDGVVDYLPSPLDKPDLRDMRSKEDREEDAGMVWKQKIEFPFSALAFKISNDPFVGRLTYLRLYSGILEKGNKIFNASSGKKERVGRLLRMHANHQEDIETASAGDIVAAVGLKFTRTGDTLCMENHPIILEEIHFPEPVISMAVEPKSQADTQKLEETLQRLTEEDPTLKMNIHKETGQRLISGMGELHLEIIKERILREANLSIRVGNPEVAYQETITKNAEVQEIVDKQIGNQKLFASLKLRLTPIKRGQGIQDMAAPTTHPPIEPWISLPNWKTQAPLLYHAIKNAIHSAATIGVSGLYPVVDFEWKVLALEINELSTESAMQLAASIAFDKALREASPVLLEPIMKLEVTTPEEFNGEVMGDLTSRRGRIHDVRAHENLCFIKAEVPLASVFGYATALRSLSKGRASYSMEPLKFDAVPKNIEEKILSWKQY